MPCSWTDFIRNRCPPKAPQGSLLLLCLPTTAQEGRLDPRNLLLCRRAGAGACPGPGATPQGAGEAVVAVTTITSSSTYSDDLPISTWYQKEQHDHKMSPLCPRFRVDPPPPAPRRPRLVVGPGQFGDQVGLLGALQPPELTKYLTVSEWEQVRKCISRLVSLTQRHILNYPYSHIHIYTHTHTQYQKTA